jgi:hypothetical protein
MQKSPATIVKEKFGDKAKLVAALTPFTQDDSWLPRVNEAKGLSRISNAKLLRLHRLFSEVKEKFGGRLKLVDAVCDLEKRTKDEGYKRRLLAYPVPRLYDLYRSLAKRNSSPAVAGAKADGGGEAPAARTKKAAKVDAAAKEAPSPAKARSESSAPAKKKAESAKSKSKP